MLSRYQAIPVTDRGELPMQAVCLSSSVSVIEADREKWIAKCQRLEAALCKLNNNRDQPLEIVDRLLATAETGTAK